MENKDKEKERKTDCKIKKTQKVKLRITKISKYHPKYDFEDEYEEM